MIIVRRGADRGHADHGWLDTYHTFSFAEYRDPEHMGHATLRVLNQDRVAPARGFSTHGHQDMEIVSYVLEGVLEHQDSMGNGSQVRPGDVQLMSAGRGVTHSEFNGSAEEPLHFLQMWVYPRTRGTEPRYEQKAFPAEQRRGALRLLVSGDGQDGSLTLDQDARLYGGLLDGAEAVDHPVAPGRTAWLHVALGSLSLNGLRLEAGDGAAIAGGTVAALRDGEQAEFVLWDLAEA